jgi:hypothetical protein
VTESHEVLLARYLQLPERLEAAIAGLTESQLDLTSSSGWSIREYVHHTVEGEWIWQVNLRAILGRDGIQFPFTWYFGLRQDDWADCWSYGTRPTGPALLLFRGSTANLVGILRNVSEKTWEHFGRVTWPGQEKESCFTVREIVEMHIRHMDQHTADIRALREMHHC